jgi:hypothetical protein
MRWFATPGCSGNHFALSAQNGISPSTQLSSCRIICTPFGRCPKGMPIIQADGGQLNPTFHSTLQRQVFH